MTHLHTGRAVRMARIFPADGRSLVLPVDDALIAGPTGQLDAPSALLLNAVDAGVDAFLGFPGTLMELPPRSKVGRIINLSASTVHATHTRKYRVGSVERAVALSADAVAVHVNITSAYEREMVSLLGEVIAETQRFELPVMAIMYPRSEGTPADENYLTMRASDPERYTGLVSHCVRVAAELGADMIKTRYTGDPLSFRQVVQASLGRPVFVAGEALADEEALLKAVAGALEGGASGVSVGRNIHQRGPDSSALLRRLRALVHQQVAA